MANNVIIPNGKKNDDVGWIDRAEITTHRTINFVKGVAVVFVVLLYVFFRFL